MDKPRFLPVEGEENTGYFRDTESNAIVYKDSDEYDKYMQSYTQRQKKKREFTDLQGEVHDLKTDVSDIKNLLLKLINKEQ
jgi:hypothetical protein|tara:strand:- start:3248 stop:3490 length:243 start_codon:yes stop_codon:yes gene_type:complete